MTAPCFKKAQYAITVVSILLVATFLASQSQWLTSLELKTVDARIHWFRKDLSAPSDVVLILIDEASLNSMQTLFGRWPWPRSVFADLIDFLSNCGAESILMDILFTERQVSSHQPATLVQDDHALVTSTCNCGNIYHSAQFNRDLADEFNRSALNKPLPADFTEKFARPAAKNTFTEANAYYLPFKELYLCAAGIGVVSIEPDNDGVYRRLPSLIQYDHYLFPALSLAPFFNAAPMGKATTEIFSFPLSVKPVRQHLLRNFKGNFFINMYGKFDAYSFGGVYLSLMKIRQGILADLPVSPEVFSGKTVFVGASAAGVEDLKHTAIGPQTPGVFLHASAYGNILTNDFLKFSPNFVQTLIMALMIGLSVSAVFFLERLYAKIFWPLLILVFWEAACLICFSQNFSLPMAGSPLAVLVAYITSLTLLNFTEGRERRKIKNVLGQYVAPAVLSKVLEHSSEEFMRAEVGSKEELTIFFSDIRGFTSLAEDHPVEKVVELLNGYLSAMTEIIFENQGTLDKFIGDAIVAFWGAPLRDRNHPLRAVQSALAMQQALSRLNRENKIRKLPQLSVGIGIHTDHVILGNIGSRRKLDYTVIGDGVNLTSRLEGLTKMYNTPILISQTTYERIHADICCRVVDYVKVKGKQKPIRIYSVLGAQERIDAKSIEIVNLTEAAFEKYTQKDFSGATEILARILALKSNDFLAKILMYRCREYQLKPPPENWDGYYEYHTK